MDDAQTTHQAEEDARNDHILIYVDGALVPKSQAVVSVYDSGFMLGDGIWEGLRLYNGHWAYLDLHLDRLFEAAKAIDLDIGLDRQGVKTALLETQSANHMQSDAHARLMVTRGVKHRPFQHPSLSRSGPTFVIIMEHSRPKLARPCAPCHGAASTRLADDTGSKIKLAFQVKLHSCLYCSGKSRGG
jgi:branched-chain amino acid aminotransferase